MLVLALCTLLIQSYRKRAGQEWFYHASEALEHEKMVQPIEAKQYSTFLEGEDIDLGGTPQMPHSPPDEHFVDDPLKIDEPEAQILLLSDEEQDEAWAEDVGLP